MSNRHHRNTVPTPVIPLSGPTPVPPSMRAGRHRRRRDLRSVPSPHPPIAIPWVPTHRSRYVRIVKPCLDRAIAVTLLVLLAPVLGAVALAVRLALGAPVLYRQERVGLGGRRFEVLKFRTMLPDRRTRAVPVTDDRRREHKAVHDPRHTPLGRRLRRWSLDELPQLVNVVRGDMSLVGPRPELVHVVARYEDWQHERHSVRPGLTGLWQVRSRGDVPMHACVDDDLDYIDRVGPIADLLLLAATPFALVTHRGA